MPRLPLTKALAEQAVKTVEKAHKRAQAQNRSSVALAAELLGISRSTMWNRIHSAASTYGLKPDVSLSVELAAPDPPSQYIGYEMEPSHLPPSYLTDDGNVVELVSRADNTYLFGAAGDLHAASKYCRWDVREDLYKTFIEEGAQCNFDTGNWIDGEMKFNRYDLEAHGLDQQVALLARNHPRGLKTYAVWGDDHEGWYVQREGINVGQYSASIMQTAGHDWIDLGYMEAHVVLRNANSGKIATLAVVHPGGGSSYATSYAIQKIIESLEGGEKPNVALYGHYHKLWAGIIRNVFTCQTGCQQDQTPFQRKKRIEAHVGGCLIKLRQDPKTGAIISMQPEIIRYFNKAFHLGSGRWSRHGPIVRVPRK